MSPLPMLVAAVLATETAKPPTEPPVLGIAQPMTLPEEEKCARWSIEGKVGWSTDAHAYALEGGVRLTRHVWATAGVVRVSMQNKDFGFVGLRYEW